MAGNTDEDAPTFLYVLLVGILMLAAFGIGTCSMQDAMVRMAIHNRTVEGTK